MAVNMEEDQDDVGFEEDGFVSCTGEVYVNLEPILSVRGECMHTVCGGSVSRALYILGGDGWMKPIAVPDNEENGNTLFNEVG